MAAPLIPVLLKLANLAGIVPSLMKFVGAGEKATKVAEQVIEVANAVTGAKDTDEAIEIFKANPDKVIEFRTKCAENERAWDEIYLADVQSARDRDIKLAQAGYRNVRAHTMYVLAVAVIIWLVYIIWSDETTNEYVKGIFTLVLGRFLGYLDAIYNFEFGTTRQSRSKDDSIDRLTSKLGG